MKSMTLFNEYLTFCIKLILLSLGQMEHWESNQIEQDLDDNDTCQFEIIF